MSIAILVLLIVQAGTAQAGTAQAGTPQAGAANPVLPARVQVSQMKAFATIGPDFAKESHPDEGSFEERELVQRLNRLARALNAFAATYQSGQVDLNEVKAVRKALHELEKSELFRPQKEK